MQREKEIAMNEYKDINDLGTSVSEPVMTNSSTYATTMDMEKNEDTSRETFMNHWNRGMTIEEFRIHCDRKLRLMYGIAQTEKGESDGEDIFD